MNLLQSAFAHQHSVESIVMTNDGLLAAGTADVKLKAINAMFQ
jgi:hypothetical protein